MVCGRVVNGIVILVCALSGISVSADYNFPKPQVYFFENGGFEVSLPADPKISLFAFHGRKNVEIDGAQSGTWNMDITKPTQNRFLFRDANEKFNLGERLHYWLYVIYEGLGYELLYQMEEVKGFRIRPPGLMKTRYDFSQPQIKFFSPRGFEVALAAEEGMTLMAFHGQVNEPFQGLSGGTFSKDIRVPENGMFVFRDRNTKLKKGDRLYFWLFVEFKGLGYHLLDKYYEYRGDELDNYQINFPSETEDETTPGIDIRNTGNAPQECPKSISMVNGKREFCVGVEIFHDDFNGATLDLNKWTVERRIAGAPDYEFVVYSDQSIATGPNGLRIEPKLLTDLFGVEQLRKDFVVPGCVASSIEPMKCNYTRGLVNDIPPPIYSSQISTSGRFSFLFGRVEIEAKLPRGSYIVPQLWLQPQGFMYDKTDYKAGQIRIATIGNIPTGDSNQGISIKQGVILAAEEPLRSAYLAERKLTSLRPNWDKEFHKFVVEWKPEGISFWMDGERSDIGNWKNSADSIPGSEMWKNKGRPAPFDQEFFLTLGLGVGGRNNFAGDIPWDPSSPTQRREFNNAKDKWYNSWKDDTKALEVKSVKVYAL